MKMQMTSFYANKLIHNLEDELRHWKEKENELSTFVVTDSENAIGPDYDFQEVSSKMESINKKIITIKHAINQANTNVCIDVGGVKMSADIMMIRIAQLKDRCRDLRGMRNRTLKVRRNRFDFVGIDDGRKHCIVEYEYINYDKREVDEAYNALKRELFKLETRLSQFNNTVRFEVDLDV